MKAHITSKFYLDSPRKWSFCTTAKWTDSGMPEHVCQEMGGTSDLYSRQNFA